MHDSDSEDSRSDSDSDGASRKKKRSKSKSKKRAPSPSSDSSDPEPSRGTKSRSKSKSKRSSSPAMEYSFDDSSTLGGAHVYRAVHPERMAHFGFSQAPCGRCPVFEFCKDGGPVNPSDCVYYDDWLGTAEVKVE